MDVMISDDSIKHRVFLKYIH